MPASSPPTTFRTLRFRSNRRPSAYAAVIMVACALVASRPATVSDVVDYRITGDDAKRLAAPYRIGTKNFAAPVEGFRSWERDSPREDGGSPTGFDSVALDYLLHH